MKANSELAFELAGTDGSGLFTKIDRLLKRL